MTIKIICGDALAELARLPAESVHCCVTSPPYYGLRDYGTASWEGGDPACDHLKPAAHGYDPFTTSTLGPKRDGVGANNSAHDPATKRQQYAGVCGHCGARRIDAQLGLEATPDAYVAAMVAVFREVRRVLRADGTLWLNIGDSYHNYRVHKDGGQPPQGFHNDRHGQPESGGRNRGTRLAGIKEKDLIGIPWMLAFALRQPWIDWQIKTEAMRAWVAGIVDGEGCITILRTKSSHSESLSFPPVVQVRMCDREPLDRLVDVAGSKIGEPQMPPTAVAANQRESWQWKLVSDKAAKVIAEIYPFLTCKRKQAIVAWNHQAFRASRGNQERKRGDLEKEQFCKDIINDLNQRRAVDIPSWMVEPRVVQEPGWYLRQDLIWSKPNPMPESVTDRCTKAHEYLFLLSKSERYYFDAAAIAEDATADRPDMATKGVRTGLAYLQQGPLASNSEKAAGRAAGNKSHKFVTEYEASDSEEHRTKAGLLKIADTVYPTRNKRSVWTVATAPYSEAHFATFPPALVDPCILAGCPRGGTVLDPFLGAGTTALVADRLGRNAIGIELNPTYAAMARRRIEDDAGLFASIAAN